MQTIMDHANRVTTKKAVAAYSVILTKLVDQALCKAEIKAGLENAQVDTRGPEAAKDNMAKVTANLEGTNADAFKKDKRSGGRSPTHNARVRNVTNDVRQSAKGGKTEPEASSSRILGKEPQREEQVTFKDAMKAAITSPDTKRSEETEGEITKVSTDEEENDGSVSNKKSCSDVSPPEDNATRVVCEVVPIVHQPIRNNLDTQHLVQISKNTEDAAVTDACVKSEVDDAAQDKEIIRIKNDTKVQTVTMSFEEEECPTREAKRHCVTDPMAVFSRLRKVHGMLSSRPDEDFDDILPKQAELDYIQRAAMGVIVFPLRFESLTKQKFSELWRLSSFSLSLDLRKLKASLVRLAQSGFYYDQALKAIFCFSCGVSWDDSSTQVAWAHLVLSPNCKHAIFEDERNIPVDVSNQYPLLLKNGQALGEENQNTTSASTTDRTQQVQYQYETDAEGGSVQTSQASISIISAGLTPSSNNRPSNEGNTSVNTQNLSLPIPPRDSDLIAQHRQYAAQSAGTAVPASSISPQLSKTGDLSGFNTPNGLKSDLVTFTTSQVPTLTASGATRDYYRFSVQATQPQSASQSEASSLQNGSQACRNNTSDHDASDSSGGDLLDDVPLPNLDLSRAASPLNASPRVRFLSFVDWPTSSGQSPRVLAAAGFFYLGSQDSIRCWYCGIILRNWRQSDDPWVTHILFRFSCEFVLAVKGENFVTQSLIHRGHTNGTGGHLPVTRSPSGSSQVPRPAIGTQGAQVSSSDPSGEAKRRTQSATPASYAQAQHTDSVNSNETNDPRNRNNRDSNGHRGSNNASSMAASASDFARPSPPDSGKASAASQDGGSVSGGSKSNDNSSGARQNGQDSRRQQDARGVDGRVRAAAPRGSAVSSEAASNSSTSRPSSGSTGHSPSGATQSASVAGAANLPHDPSTTKPISTEGEQHGSGGKGKQRSKVKPTKSASVSNKQANGCSGSQTLQVDSEPSNESSGQAGQNARSDVPNRSRSEAAGRSERTNSTTPSSNHQQSSASAEQRGCTPLTDAAPRDQTVAPEDAEEYYHRLQADNRRLRERRLCKICRRNTIDTIFLPCGHICTCDACSCTVRECVLCYQRIRGTAHVYLE